MARKSKYTSDTLGKLVEAIRMGATYELAANYAGITFQTFNEWRASKPEFSDLIKQAEGEAALVWLTKIQEAANDGNWQAAAWKLERRYPHMYGRQVQEHTGEVKQTHEHSGAIALQFNADAVLARIAGGSEADS